MISAIISHSQVTFCRFPNTTGAFELDLSLVDNFDAAWRELNGVKTDVFCAGSVTLPDKIGRQINVGGFSGESTFGLRLFTPNGAPGVNSTGDWEEDYPALALQVRDGRGHWVCLVSVLIGGHTERPLVSLRRSSC